MQIWINKKYISKITTNIVSTIYAFLGFIGTWVSFDQLLSDSLNIWIRIGISLGVLSGIWSVCFLIVGCVLTKKKRVGIITVNNGRKLYLQYGDLFDKNEVLHPDNRRNIVIPVNRCFDTIIDNQVISEKTLHGKAFKELYSRKIYTKESLNIKIKQLLSGQEYESLQEGEKPAGNRERYPVGTVVDLPVTRREHYLLWALSTFDNKLNAHTSMQDFSLAVQKLIEACNTKSEGFPVVMPLVGTGLSRTKKGQQEIITYLLSAFKINKDEINCDIHIVIQKNMKDAIPILSFK